MNIFASAETQLALTLTIVGLLAFFLLPKPWRAKLLGIKLTSSKQRRFGTVARVALLSLPLFVAAFAISYMVTGLTQGSSVNRLSDNWRSTEETMRSQMPSPERKSSQYWVKEGQTLDELAQRFSVDANKLSQLNAHQVVVDTRIVVPPVEQPLQPLTSSGNLASANITEEQGAIRVSQNFNADPIITTIPELAQQLARYNAIAEVSAGVYRLERTISIENNIRLDITNASLQKLLLNSAPGNAVCLCLTDASALVKGIEVTSVDPSSNSPDTNSGDGRSYIRAQNSRFDIIDSYINHLGSDVNRGPAFLQDENATYGISWRVPTSQKTTNIATGWVENSTFSQNYSGAFAQGVAGMTWRNNTFVENSEYGVSVQASTGALFEKNTFKNNGKHGLLLSKASDSNLIKDNTIEGNKLHGVVVHEGATHNYIEDNVVRNNVDNFVVHNAQYTTLKDNAGYNASKNNVRINEQSSNTFVMGNDLRGGNKGVYVYGSADDIYIASNQIHGAKQILATDDVQNVLFAHNSVDTFNYEVGEPDQLILGPNTTAAPPEAEQ